MRIFLKGAGLFLVMLIVVSSCIERFDFKPGSFDDYVVIYGRISNQPGPYKVNISHGIRLDKSKRRQLGITKAKVTISDDTGFSEQLIETGDGNYFTNALVGEVGRTYTLEIRTDEGEIYSSTPEVMIPVGEIVNLRKEFVMAVPPTDTINRPLLNGFNIVMTSRFTPEQQKHVRWKWSGTFEFTSDPTSQGYFIGTKVFVPDPPPCTGYRGYFQDPLYVLLPLYPPGPPVCTCCECWHTALSEELMISNEDDVKNGEIADMTLDFIPVGFNFFQNTFLMVVEQESVSPTVYEFYKRSKTVGDTGSDLFQTVPPRTVGNVVKVNDVGRPVLGIFSVGSTRSDTLRIYKTDIPYTPDPAIYSKQECDSVYRSGITTHERPPWYN